MFAAAVFFHHARRKMIRTFFPTKYGNSNFCTFFWLWKNQDISSSSIIKVNVLRITFLAICSIKIWNFYRLFVFVYLFWFLFLYFCVSCLCWLKWNELLIEAVQTRFTDTIIWMPLRMNDKGNSEKKSRLFWLHTHDFILRNRRVEKRTKTYFQRHICNLSFFCYHCRFDTRTHTFCNSTLPPNTYASVLCWNSTNLTDLCSAVSIRKFRFLLAANIVSAASKRKRRNIQEIVCDHGRFYDCDYFFVFNLWLRKPSTANNSNRISKNW